MNHLGIPKRAPVDPITSSKTIIARLLRRLSAPAAERPKEFEEGQPFGGCDTQGPVGRFLNTGRQCRVKASMTVCVSYETSSNNSWQPKLRAPLSDPLEESLMSIVDALTPKHV